MKTPTVLRITQGAMIAALYVCLTYVSAFFGLSSGAIQLRLSEALCILAAFTPAAVWGLPLGCALANALTGCLFWDVVFGSLATFLGALVARLLRKLPFWVHPLPNVFFNTLIVPFVLVWVYGVPEGLPYLFLTVGIGEILSCQVLGMLLYPVLNKRRKILGFDQK
ncbi:MAG: QueT transporter family protein [Clostridia bacterium]|nr:QueT transporter family protein [Clostridia bacterium]